MFLVFVGYLFELVGLIRLSTWFGVLELAVFGDFWFFCLVVCVCDLVFRFVFVFILYLLLRVCGFLLLL